jgi:hypothetical protein
VEPESVTVAQAFTLVVVVRAPASAQVVFPAGPDSSQLVEAVDPPADASGEDTAGTFRIGTYRLVAWETGVQTVPLDPVVVGEGQYAKHLDVRPQVIVTSVLPLDTALRKPRPALGVLDSAFAWWPWALGAAAAIGALWWWRRRRRTRRRKAPPPTALAVAQSALARVDALGVLEAGEPSRHIALHADVLRGYLSARADAASRSHTNTELVTAIRGYGLPNDRIALVLQEADQVQFARRPVSVERARDYAKEIQGILEACEEHFARSIPAAAPPKRAA